MLCIRFLLCHKCTTFLKRVGPTNRRCAKTRTFRTSRRGRQFAPKTNQPLFLHASYKKYALANSTKACVTGQREDAPENVVEVKVRVAHYVGLTDE